MNNNLKYKPFDIKPAGPGVIPPCPVGPDALIGIPRQQTNPSPWEGGGWQGFVAELAAKGIVIDEQKSARTLYVTDAGGMAYGLPRGVLIARNAEMVSMVMASAQKHQVPVTVRGGGLTTEGETVSFGGLQLDMRGMSRVLAIDKDAMTVRCEAGIYWHSLAESLRRRGLDYLSAPLNMTSSVGGTLGVGGIDINSPRLGCSADQALAITIVTPRGEVLECSETENAWWFNRVLLGYGQFGIITEAVLRIRPFTPLAMHYFYYGDLRTAMEDLVMLFDEDAADYTGILTMLDRAVNLLVAFDSDEREQSFFKKYRSRLRGFGELGFALRTGLYYTVRPWKFREALYLLNRKRTLLPALQPCQGLCIQQFGGGGGQVRAPFAFDVNRP